MEQVVEHIGNILAQQLGNQLEAIFLYGSLAQGFYQAGESDINLLVVLADGTPIYTFHSIFRPIWEEHGHLLRRAPLIAHRHDFVRHMLLNPALKHHLLKEAQLLQGKPTLLGGMPTVDPQDIYARQAAEAMQLSSVLAANLLEPEVAQADLSRLRNLARRIVQKPIKPGVTAAQLFARIQHHLEAAMATLPVDASWATRRISTSPLLPGLQAIYKKEMGTVVLVFARLTPEQIMSTNWRRIGERLADEYTTMQVTTATQLQLVTELERPLDVHFRRYEHTWGLDPLESVQVSPWYIMRQAARLPSDIQIDHFPNAYLTKDAEQAHKIIHDFQNKMLNVQLENEILYRMQQVDRFVAPTPLPDRNTPPEQRLAAIFQHLGWWADHYANEMPKYE